MKLWVLRHGEAVPYGSCPDSERALTEQGRKEALNSAARLIGQPLTAIYASPYLRAQQTAQIVREALGFETWGASSGPYVPRDQLFLRG